MPNIDFSIKINTNKLFYDILRSIKAEMSKRMRKASVNILREFKLLIADAIENHPTYLAILNGELQHELGIKNPSTVLPQLVNAIVNNIFIDVKPPLIKNSEIYSEINIGVLASDYSDILGKSFSEFMTENGSKIPWLQWLLIEGDKFIITGYTYIVEPTVVEKSRTDKGIMHKSTRSWRVPPAHSGTPDDNFLTRALDSLDASIDKIISQEF